MARLHQLRLAMMMLSRLPMGRLPDPAPTLADAAWAFPLVGVVIGAIGWACVGGALALGVPAMTGALLALVAMALATGALHEDGLADLADGLGGGRDRAHCLEIMRDSRIGSYGVVALVFMVGLKATALSELALVPLLWAMLFAAVTSRWLMLAALVLLPSARADGMGHAAAGPGAMTLWPGLLVLGALGVALGPLSLIVLGLMVLAAWGVAALAHRRIGGQTGDVLGAVQAVSETAGLIALAAVAA